MPLVVSDSCWSQSVCWRSRKPRSSAGNEAKDSRGSSLYLWHWHLASCPRAEDHLKVVPARLAGRYDGDRRTRACHAYDSAHSGAHVACKEREFTATVRAASRAVGPHQRARRRSRGAVRARVAAVLLDQVAHQPTQASLPAVGPETCTSWSSPPLPRGLGHGQHGTEDRGRALAV